MGGGGDKPKQQVTDYFLTLHCGVAHQVDAVLEITVNDKLTNAPAAGANTVVVIDDPEMFGGVKKEGGISGLMHVLLGGEDQVLSPGLAERYNGTPTTVPAYRGVTTLFFTGGGGAGGLFSGLVGLFGRFRQRGFYWTSNTQYLRPVAAKVRRVPKIQDFPKAKSVIGNRSLRTSTFITIAYGLGGSPTLPSAAAQAFAHVFESLKLVVQGGTAVDVGVSWCTNSRVQTSSFTNATVGNLEALRLLVLDLPTPSDVVANGIQSAMEAANAWFAVSLADTTIKKRTLMFFSGLQDWVGGNLIDSGQLIAEDMVTREGGLFNKESGTQVDCYAFTPLTTDFTKIAYYDNTPEDGAPHSFQGDVGTPSYDDNAKMVVYRALYGRAGLTVNGAHIILEAFTDDDWGIGLPLSRFDLASFELAADILFDEGLGLALQWSGQSTIETFINDVLSHIDGTYGTDPATGKIYIQLARGGYDVDSLFELTPDNCTVTKMQRKTLTGTTNEIVVTYTDPENEKEVTVPVHDQANYATQAVLVSSSANYYGVRSAELAVRLGQRDLNKLAAPLASFDIDCTREAWQLKSGDVVKITYPEHGLVDLPIRILTTTSGKPGEMKISLTAIEDVFEMPTTAYVTPPGGKWEDPRSLPKAMVHVQLGTAPYYLLAQLVGDANAAAAVAPAVPSLILGAQDDADTRSFDLFHATVDSTGTPIYAAIGTMYQAGWVASGEVLPLEAASVIDEYSSQAGDVYPGPGVLVWIGSGDPAQCELAMISDIDVAGMHLDRGILDTTIRQWPSGTPMWFLDPNRNYLDSIERIDGVPVSYKLCPTTSMGTLAAASAPVSSVTPDDRIYRPYRPANVKLNATYWPDTIATTDITVTFSRRNRLLENPVIVPWTAGDVPPEAGTTYTARVYRVDTDALLTETTGITGTSVVLTPVYDGEVRLELFAVRDGLESYQKFIHQFLFSASDFRSTTTGSARITTDGQTRLIV